MLWSDLEVGDVLEYTDEYKEKVVPNFSSYIGECWATSKRFEIDDVLPYEKYVILGFKQTGGQIISLTLEGYDELLIEFGNIIVFKIVSLRKEKLNGKQ